MPEMIDSETPDAAKTRTGFDGMEYELVFSDEFNTPGRSFYPGAYFFSWLSLSTVVFLEFFSLPVYFLVRVFFSFIFQLLQDLLSFSMDHITPRNLSSCASNASAR
jgi:hypothetical protein